MKAIQSPGSSASPLCTTEMKAIKMKAHERDCSALLRQRIRRKHLANQLYCNRSTSSRLPLIECVWVLSVCYLGRLDRANARTAHCHTSTSESTALEWVPATKVEWRDLQRRRGCGKARFDRSEDSKARYSACCSRMLPPPQVTVTPVRHLVLKGVGGNAVTTSRSNSIGFGLLPFLERVLAGGVLTFVGDSVTQQAYVTHLLVHCAVRRCFF